MSNKKDTGSYYTPDILASIILKHISPYIEQFDELRLLEPSAGDGSFVKKFEKELFLSSKKQVEITCIEIEKEELLKIENFINSTQAVSVKYSFLNEDFLQYTAEGIKKFDVIIGNPPYINKKRLSKEQIKRCQDIHDSLLKSNFNVKNVWTAFLLKSLTLVSDSGLVAFVLPAELLQVSYTQDIRSLFYDHFKRVEIVSFKQLLFDDAGQDTVILIGYKLSKSPGIFISTVENIHDLNDFQFHKHPPEIRVTDKDVHHNLSSDELLFLSNLKKRVNTISHYCSSKPGIVTAANSYFIVSETIKNEFELTDFAFPILQKSSLFNGKIDFKLNDFQTLVNANCQAYLLNFNKVDATSFSDAVRQYIEFGVTQNLPDRYKCMKRKRWFDIPNITSPKEAFFFKRCHEYPKFIKNSAQVYVTDSAYQVEMKKSFTTDSLIFSFYNSLTLVYAELYGRFYGGGVLELIPSEFKALPIPYLEIDSRKYTLFNKAFENKESIEQVLLQQDTKILNKVLGTSSDDIQKLELIRNKLVKRRIRRS